MRSILCSIILAVSVGAGAQDQNPQVTPSTTASKRVEIAFPSGQRKLSLDGFQRLHEKVYNNVEEYRQELENSGVDLKSGRVVVKEVLIESRTDAKGSAESNLAISQDRADGLQVDLTDIFTSLGVDVSKVQFSSVGLGEDGADSSACSYTETICRNTVPLKKISSPEAEQGLRWVVKNFLIKVNQLILPVSHAGSILDLILGNDREQREFREYQRRNRRQNNGFGVDDFDENYYPKRPKREPRQCTRTVWDENCLANQRITSIQMVLDFEVDAVVDSNQVEQKPLPDVMTNDENKAETPVVVDTESSTKTTPDEVIVEKKKPAQPPRLIIYGKPVKK